MVFVAGDALRPANTIFHSHGLTEAQLLWYQDEEIQALDLAASRQWLQMGITVGTAAANHQLFGSIENYKLAIGEAYPKLFQKVDVLYQLGCMLESTEFRQGVLGFNRGAEEQPFTNAEVAAANRLTPHFRRALQIHRQLMYVREQNAQLYSMLDNMVAGVLLLDANARVCYANPAAENLLSKNSALSSSARYGLKAANAEQWAEMNTLIQGAIKIGTRERHYLHGEDYKPGGVISLNNTSGDKPLMLTITPLSEMSGYDNLTNDNIAAAIFITDLNASRVLAKKLLRKNYLLSERECDVCEAFLNSASLEGTADITGLSISTVRSHLKENYSKTKQHSQAELMRLLMALTLEFEHIC
jgi:DNA-binding CsgD family transcriptional regulator/PAS domain-containing protein